MSAEEYRTGEEPAELDSLQEEERASEEALARECAAGQGEEGGAGEGVAALSEKEISSQIDREIDELGGNENQLE